MGVAISAAVFALALWRQVRRYKRLETQISTGEQILERALAKAEGRHLWRVKTLVPVAAGVELARRNPLPSTAALGAAIMTGAALLIPVEDKKGLDAEMAPVQPSVPMSVEPALTEDGTDVEPEAGDIQAGDDEPEVAMAATSVDEPSIKISAPAATEAVAPTTTLAPSTSTTTSVADVATIAVTVAAPATTVPSRPELPTPEPEPKPDPAERGCTIGLNAELGGLSARVCV